MNEEEDIYEVEEILDYKTIRGNDYYYIHWKGFDRPEDNTWEPLENLGNCLGLVEAFFTKFGLKIPENVEILLQYLREDDEIEDNDGIKKDSEIKEDNEIKKDDIKNDYDIKSNDIKDDDDINENNENINDDEIKENLSQSIISDAEKQQPETQPQIEQNTSISDQEYSLESKDDLTESPRSIKLSSDDNNFYPKDERSDYDDLDPPNTVKKTYTISSKGLRKIKERNDKDSDSESNSNLWDFHRTRSHVKTGQYRSRKDLSFTQNRQIELEVYRICGKRQFGKKVEYLVEFRCTADKFCWIREQDLNCDEEIERYERKKKSCPPEMPLSYFKNRDDLIPHISPERIAKAKDNLARLRHELLGTPGPNVKNITSEELLQFYEQEALQEINSLD